MLKFGCKVIDKAIGNALLTGMLTELAGESAVGKTQIALQLSLMAQLPKDQGGLSGGTFFNLETLLIIPFPAATAFICTEDAFPHQRLMQIVSAFGQQHDYLPEKDPAKSIFVEHCVMYPRASMNGMCNPPPLLGLCRRPLGCHLSAPGAIA